MAWSKGVAGRVKSVKVGRGKDFHGNVGTLRVFLLARHPPARASGAEFPLLRGRSTSAPGRGEGEGKKGKNRKRNTRGGHGAPERQKRAKREASSDKAAKRTCKYTRDRARPR